MYMGFLSFLISPKKLILSSCQIYFVIKCNNLHNFPEFNTINDLYLQEVTELQSYANYM